MAWKMIVAWLTCAGMFALVPGGGADISDLKPFHIEGPATLKGIPAGPDLQAILDWDAGRRFDLKLAEPATGVVLHQATIETDIVLFEDQFLFGGCVHDLDFTADQGLGPVGPETYFSLVAEERIRHCGGEDQALAFGSYLAWNLILEGTTVG